MKNFRKCHVCRRQWKTFKGYLQDSAIQFYGSRERNGINYFIFTCIACGSKHEVKAEMARTLEPDVRGLLIQKLQIYINKLSGKTW